VDALFRATGLSAGEHFLGMTWRQRRNTLLSSPRRRGSSTLRPIDSIINVSGILDHPLLRAFAGDDDRT
jgi:hypothetical protein